MRRMMMFVLMLLGALGSGVVSGQQADSITVEWIYSPASARVTALPAFQWLNNGTALFYDRQQTAESRTFEIFDPKTGRRLLAIDRQQALASMRSLLGDHSATASLRWPAAFDAGGRRALYLLDGDLFVLELASAAFSRITETRAAEKAATFSPDGNKLAFVRNNDLYVYDLARKTEQRLTWDGNESLLNGTLTWLYWEEIFGRRDIGYWWSDDSKFIAYLQANESGVTTAHFVDFQPVPPTLIKQAYPFAGSKNPLVRAGVVAAAGGKTVWCRPFAYDYAYIARVQWLPDNQRLAIQTMPRDQQALDLYFVDRGTGEARHVLRETDDGWVNIHDDLYFLRDGKHFIWQSERDGYAHLYRYSMDGKLVNQITKGEWAVRAAGGGVFWLRQAVTGIDEARGWLYFTALEKSSIEKHLYRIKMDGSQMTRLSREDGSHSITFSPDTKYYFDTFSTISTPPVLRLHSSDGKLQRTMASGQTDVLASLNMRYPELFFIPAGDGFPMPAQMLKPADFDATRKYPVILNVYGGPSAPTVANAWQTANYFDQVLLRHGYLVVKFDNRSATAISKKLENTILHQMYGDGELNDLVDAVRWLKQQSYVDPQRIGIWGSSGGGMYTLLALTRSQEFKAGIAAAAVSDWHYYDTKWTEAVMKTPQANRDGYAKTSLLQYAKNLHGRLLLVHGTYDDNVHPQHAWHFIDELIKADKRFDMMFYPMRMHSISDIPARIHLFNTMVEFWRKNL